MEELLEQHSRPAGIAFGSRAGESTERQSRLQSKLQVRKSSSLHAFSVHPYLTLNYGRQFMLCQCIFDCKQGLAVGDSLEEAHSWVELYTISRPAIAAFSLRWHGQVLASKPENAFLAAWQRA